MQYDGDGKPPPLRCPHCKKRVGPRMNVAVMLEPDRCYHCGGMFKISRLGKKTWAEPVRVDRVG